MRIATAFIEICETLGGSRAPSERLERSAGFRIFLGLWWLFLFCVALAFCGRDVKFIYIDF